MRVEDIIKTKGDVVVTVAGDASLCDAARFMKDHGIGALIVITPAGNLHGVVSEREITLALALHGRGAVDIRVHEVMLLDSPAVAPSDRIVDAMKVMTDQRVRHLPVVVDRSVVGLLSIGDVVKARLSEKIAENRVLQDMARWPRDEAA